MRVLMLAQFYPPVIGGEERHVLSLSEGLVARGHDVVVATMPHPARPAEAVINGVTVHSLRGAMQRASILFSERERPHTPPFPDPELAWRVASIVREFKPDVIHGHNWMRHSYVPSWFHDRPAVVATLHDYSLICAIKTLERYEKICPGPRVSACLPCATNHFGPLMGGVTATANFVSSRLLRRSADHFIAVSDAVAESCGLVDGNVPYDVLPTFIPDNVAALPELADERVKLLPPDGFLLFVGDLNRRKGVQVLVDAYAKLRNAPPLVLIGRRCPDTPAHLPENVLLFESWPYPAVMYAWSKCLFGIAPSTFVEPCGTIVMEANALGRSMIATNHGGLADLVDHGRTGLHVPPSDTPALAAAMQLLLDNAPLRAELGRGAAARAPTFMAQTAIPQIEAIYGAARKRRAALSRAARVEAPRELEASHPSHAESDAVPDGAAPK
jgi:glycosyltransferase involved in cell wall biosynthesis